QDRHGALGPGALAGLSGMHEARLPAGLSPNDGDRKRQLSAASGAAVTVMTAPTQDPWTPPPQPSPPLQQTCRSSFDVDSATIIISPEEILDGVSLAAIAPTDVVGRCASVGVIGAEILPSSDILVSTVQQPSLDCSESGLQLSMATNAGSLFSTSTISPGSLDDPCDASIFLPTDDVMGICSGGSAPNPCRSNCNDTVTSAATSAATNAAGVATTTTAANGLGDDRPPGNITGSVGRSLLYSRFLDTSNQGTGQGEHAGLLDSVVGATVLTLPNSIDARTLHSSDVMKCSPDGTVAAAITLASFAAAPPVGFHDARYAAALAANSSFTVTASERPLFLPRPPAFFRSMSLRIEQQQHAPALVMPPDIPSLTDTNHLEQPFSRNVHGGQQRPPLQPLQSLLLPPSPAESPPGQHLPSTISRRNGLRAALLQGGAVTTAACKDNATAAMAGAQRRFFRRGHSSGLVPHLAGGTAEPHMRGRSPNGGLVMQAWKEVEAEVGRTAVSVQPSPTAASGAVGRLTLSRAGTSERVSEADAVSPDVFNSTAASGGARSGINVLSGTNGKVTPARLATPSMAVPAAPVVASSNGRRFLNKVSNQ
ncbi:hypothetical protein Vretifemale_20173, partial [Volvox reticuliferus]